MLRRRQRVSSVAKRKRCQPIIGRSYSEPWMPLLSAKWTCLGSQPGLLERSAMIGRPGSDCPTQHPLVAQTPQQVVAELALDYIQHHKPVRLCVSLAYTNTH